jgi:hypothetical protein
MAVEITSGDLKHKVVFKQPASSLNDEGGKETTYTNAILSHGQRLKSLISTGQRKETQRLWLVRLTFMSGTT